MKRILTISVLVFLLSSFLPFLPGARVSAQQCPTITITYQRDSRNHRRVRFTAALPENQSNLAATYVWQFGDGNTGNSDTSPTTQHTYATDGTYTVEVDASVAELGQCSATQEITISPPKRRKEPAPTPMPYVPTCPTLPDHVVVIPTSPRTECQLVDGPGVGNRSLVEAGYIDAVDVWNHMGDGAEVCFRAAGDIRFLDAATAPRRLLELPSYGKEGMTCTAIDRAGTVVLIPEPPAPPLVKGLADCMVTTTHILNLRTGPAGESMRWLPWNVTLTALERRAGWFLVDYHGEKGWISAAYVRPQGDCD